MPRDRPTFLTLPLELRLDIYTHLLVLPPPPPPERQQPIYRCAHPYSPSPEEKPTIHTQILLVNRQTNREATPLLYTLNTFTAHPALLTVAAAPTLLHFHHHAVYRSSKTLGIPSSSSSKWTKLIRKWNLRVRIDAAAPPPPWNRSQVSAAFSHAQELTLDLWSGAFSSSSSFSSSMGMDGHSGVVEGEGEREGGRGADVLRLFEGVRGVRRVRVVGMVVVGGGLEGYVKWLTKRMTSMDQEEGDVDGDRRGSTTALV
ncbi:uncharacterized protein B0T15DRAFT_491500 [Chaetomium strumarium]|uniref:Uncharacterized protein n=1 Tax=Chaetomium strumarium TaxID=1170767 RepID=A0AAJ0GZY4_9PEZI|nr:hypothetical protein B0T15DRAFT_491500 [Chaetomium strumarium]